MRPLLTLPDGHHEIDIPLRPGIYVRCGSLISAKCAPASVLGAIWINRNPPSIFTLGEHRHYLDYLTRHARLHCLALLGA